MPLISPDNSEIIEVTCMCGKRSPSYAAHYAHFGECPLDRCQHCLMVLGDPPFDKPSEHKCPYHKIAELERGRHV